MLSVIFASLGSFISEISSSIIKFETDHKKESIYTAGFINMLFGMFIFASIAFFRDSFVFSLASLPTFSVKAFLEILQGWATMNAIQKVDRSSYAFIRNLTIPLLLLADYFIGFTLRPAQLAGILVIFIV